mmetsp:Transcript_15618/g.46566  ORF Transcript_15618/g.46566 Transcript_15618/m.46566 type:complete len:203 (+) Transcript_15618:136-744(+)
MDRDDTGHAVHRTTCAVQNRSPTIRIAPTTVSYHWSEPNGRDREPRHLDGGAIILLVVGKLDGERAVALCVQGLEGASHPRLRIALPEGQPVAGRLVAPPWHRVVPRRVPPAFALLGILAASIRVEGLAAAGAREGKPGALALKRHGEVNIVEVECAAHGERVAPRLQRRQRVDQVAERPRGHDEVVPRPALQRRPDRPRKA